MNGDHKSYGKQRFVIIVVIAVVLASIAWAVGYPLAALGAVAAIPVASFNHLLMVIAMKRSKQIEVEEKQSDGSTPTPMSTNIQLQFMAWSLVRMVVSGAALLISLTVGPEFVIGMLIGLMSELMTYIGDTVRMLLIRPGN